MGTRQQRLECVVWSDAAVNQAPMILAERCTMAMWMSPEVTKMHKFGTYSIWGYLVPTSISRLMTQMISGMPPPIFKSLQWQQMATVSDLQPKSSPSECLWLFEVMDSKLLRCLRMPIWELTASWLAAETENCIQTIIMYFWVRRELWFYTCSLASILDWHVS